MYEAATRFKTQVDGDFSSVDELKLAMITSFEAMLEEDISTNKQIGDHGAAEILARVGKSNVRVLTHCNTGSLATAGYGTALGVIRSLHLQKSLDHAYCTETRPYNQGKFCSIFEYLWRIYFEFQLTESFQARG